MAVKKTLESKFLDKIVSVYLRLLEEKKDEDEAQRLMGVFVRKALGKLGFKGTAEKLELRTRQIAALASERARMTLERSQFLLELRLGKDSGSYSVGFLPGVQIPNTPENQESWREFLETLAAKTRIGPDPDTGEIGILYRDGTWLGDLMLADDVRSFSVLPAITRVKGSLVARGALMVNKTFTHRLAVDGDLVIHHDMLRQDPPDVRFAGDLKLIGLKTMLDASFAPERLLAWGLEPGRSLVLRSDTFTLEPPQTPSETPCVLRGENILSNFTWRGEQWLQTKQERLPEETFEAVHSRLNRLCLELGLGSNFIAKSVSRVPDNIDRISLYLDWAVAHSEGKKSDAADPEAEATRRLLAALHKVRTLFGGKRIDAKGVELALADIGDADREQAVALAARPRPKLNEKLAQADLETVTALLDQETNPLDLLGDGLGTARALNLAFRSPEMRANLEQALSPLKKAFDEILAILRSPEPPLFSALLNDPEHMLLVLRNALRAFAQPAGLAALEAELRELRATAPKELVRRVANVPFAAETQDFAADKALLRELFQLGRCELDKLPFDARTMLAFIVPSLHSVAEPRLHETLCAMSEAPAQDGSLAASLAGDLAPLPPDKLVAALRSWIRLNLETVRKYNELSTADYAGQREAEREEKERAMIALPPEVARDITGRMNRMCLILGLGRTFLDTGAVAMEANLRKLDHYLALALAIVPGAPAPVLSQEDRDVVEEALEGLRTLLHCLDTADTDAANEALKAFTDQRLGKLAEILAKPRNPAQTLVLKRDADYLDGLKDTRLSLDRVFNSSGRFLLFANSCLESKEMKKAISVYIKPIYFAISAMGSRAGGVTTNDILRNACDPGEFLNRMTVGGNASEARDLSQALEKICAKSIHTLVADLRKGCPPGAQGELARDCEFLGYLLALEGSALGSLQLDSKNTGRLLLLNLDSHLGDWTRTMFETGRLSGRTPKQIIAAVLDRAQWELEIMRVFNKHTTRRN